MYFITLLMVSNAREIENIDRVYGVLYVYLPLHADHCNMQ